MISKSRIVEAAARVYGEYGFRGATTRRIAEAAGVNEVTLFRQFGSKSALIAEVLRTHAAATGRQFALPDVPVDPERELTAWATSHLAHLRASRSLIRKTMGDIEERPEMCGCISEGPTVAARALKAYMMRMREAGFVAWTIPPAGRRNEEAHAAGAMLMGALFADAMGRDMMPEMYPRPAGTAAAMYVRLFLCAIGACDPPASLRGARRVAPRARRSPSTKTPTR